MYMGDDFQKVIKLYIKALIYIQAILAILLSIIWGLFWYQQYN